MQVTGPKRQKPLNYKGQKRENTPKTPHRSIKAPLGTKKIDPLRFPRLTLRGPATGHVH